jgi:diguanylate cyclase (GGDEF)-like protein
VTKKRRLIFHKNLVVQISVFVSFVSIATITFLSAYISHQQSEATVQQLQHQAIVVADSLAVSTSSYVITKDYTSIEEILLRAVQFDSIASIQIIDARGKVLSNVAKDKNGGIAPLFNKLRYVTPTGQELKITQSDDKMEIYKPIILGDLVGWARIVYSLESVIHTKAGIWKTNLATGFLITILTIIILIYFLRKPIVSIKKYTEFAAKLNEYKGDEIKVDKRSIELSRLGEALNRASINLHGQHRKLKSMMSAMESIAAIAEHSPDIILSIGANNSIEYINETANKTVKELFKSNDKQYILKLLPKDIDKIINHCISQNTSLNDIESQVKDHIYLWKFTQLKSQGIVHCHGIDITEKKRAEEKLTRQTNYDLLTDLPNRILALDRLKQSIIRSKRLNSHVGILFLGVDRFKTVIDTLDHSSGDKVVLEVSKRLSNCIREGDTVARFGGDVFLIILNDLRQALDSNIVAEKAIKAMSDEFDVDDHKFLLGLSIGITGSPDDDIDANILIRNADIAMHKAKEAGGNTYQFYTPEFNEQALVKVEMESELRYALGNDELFLNFQPQIDIANNRLIGAEALIRWVNGKLGFVPPDRFISMAEDTGLIIPIGEWVLKTACTEAKKWQGIFNVPLRVAVNVSARQFIGHDFPVTVKKVLEETGLSADKLELEITESLLVEDAHNVLLTIEHLKEIGVTLALDDFGTGYSSLSYLKRFPFDILKIDRSFVQDVLDNPDDASLCKAIVAIAASLKLNVIGEGVETKEQLDFLRAIGTDTAQGYFYSKPLEASSFIEYVNTFQKSKIV